MRAMVGRRVSSDLAHLVRLTCICATVFGALCSVYTGTKFPFDPCYQDPGMSPYYAQLQNYTILSPTSSEMCLMLKVRRPFSLCTNHTAAGKATRCCNTGINKIKLFPDNACVGSIREYTLNGSPRTSIFWEAEGTQYIMKATPLALDNAAAVVNTILCFTLQKPCETMTKFAFDHQVLEYALYDKKEDGYECCPSSVLVTADKFMVPPPPGQKAPPPPPPEPPYPRFPPSPPFPSPPKQKPPAPPPKLPSPSPPSPKAKLPPSPRPKPPPLPSPPPKKQSPPPPPPPSPPPPPPPSTSTNVSPPPKAKKPPPPPPPATVGSPPPPPPTDTALSPSAPPPKKKNRKKRPPPPPPVYPPISPGSLAPPQSPDRGPATVRSSPPPPPPPPVAASPPYVPAACAVNILLQKSTGGVNSDLCNVYEYFILLPVMGAPDKYAPGVRSACTVGATSMQLVLYFPTVELNNALFAYYSDATNQFFLAGLMGFTLCQDNIIMVSSCTGYCVISGSSCNSQAGARLSPPADLTTILSNFWGQQPSGVTAQTPVSSPSSTVPLSSFVYQGNKYLIFQQSAAFTPADMLCQRYGGWLASIQTSAENQIIVSQVLSLMSFAQSGAVINVWFGLYVTGVANGVVTGVYTNGAALQYFDQSATAAAGGYYYLSCSADLGACRWLSGTAGLVLPYVLCKQQA